MIRKLKSSKVVIKKGVILGRRGSKKLLPFLAKKGLVKIVK